MCVCVYIYIYIYIDTHKHKHTHTHAHTRAYTRSHKHTHTLLQYGTKATCTMSEGFSILFKVLKFFSSLKALTCSVTYLTCLFNEHSGKMPRHESHHSLASSADIKNTWYSNSTSATRLIASTVNVLFLCRKWFGYVHVLVSMRCIAPQGSPRTPTAHIAATTPRLIVRILNSVILKTFKNF